MEQPDVHGPKAPLTIPQVQALFGTLTVRWWLSGGYAIDHRLGRVSREHGDIDVSTLRPLLPALLERLPGTLVPFAAMSGRVRALAQHLDDPLLHNIWVHDHLTHRWVLQINLENGDDEHWAYRRHPDITLPWHRAVQPVDGVPTGSPATQLLWKAKSPRAVDEHDLAVTHLSTEDQAWLQHSIRTAHPDSPWVLRHTDT